MTNSRKHPESNREEATQARLILAAIVESSDDAIIGKDLNGTITDWNTGAERLYGYSADEVIGKPISLLLPPDHSDDFAAIMRKIGGGELVKHFETVRQKKDGTRIELSLTVSPIIDAEGRIVGAATIARDITERKRVEAALRESEELLHMAAQAGRMFAYEWDASTDKIVRSEGVKQILGEDEATHTTGQQILSMIPPEDRMRLNAAIARLSPEKPYLQIRYRMVRSDGNVIWVDRSSRAHFDEHGKMLRIVGMIADITDRVRAAEVLGEKERELSEAQRLAGVGSWYWDVQNDKVTWSEELYRNAGLDPKLPAPSYKEIPQFYTPESWERLQRAVEKALRDGASYELDLEVVRPDGTTRWVRTRGEAVGDTTGRIVGLRGTAQDITDRKLTDEAIAVMSRKLLNAQEQERARIARELHDDIIQRLAVLAIELRRSRDTLNDAPKVRDHLHELQLLTEVISTDVYALAHELHSSTLECLGVVTGMRSWCAEFGERQQLEIDFKSHDVPRLPQDISLCLFRVLQEALHNAAKHSGTKRIEVQLAEKSGEIHLIVSDSGRGFDIDSAMRSRGLGLTSMQERVRLVGGTILIDSKLLAGTTVYVCVPLRAKLSAQRAAG
jgi:PAS domain S-box-containing protein